VELSAIFIHSKICRSQAGVKRELTRLSILIIVFSGVRMSWDVVAIIISETFWIALACPTLKRSEMSLTMIRRHGSEAYWVLSKSNLTICSFLS
jgi:hypothetical protein